MSSAGGLAYVQSEPLVTTRIGTSSFAATNGAMLAGGTSATPSRSVATETMSSAVGSASRLARRTRRSTTVAPATGSAVESRVTQTSAPCGLHFVVTPRSVTERR